MISAGDFLSPSFYAELLVYFAWYGHQESLRNYPSEVGNMEHLHRNKSPEPAAVLSRHSFGTKADLSRHGSRPGGGFAYYE